MRNAWLNQENARIIQVFLIIIHIMQKIIVPEYILLIKLKDVLIIVVNVWKFQKHVNNTQKQLEMPDIFVKK